MYMKNKGLLNTIIGLLVLVVLILAFSLYLRSSDAKGPLVSIDGTAEGLFLERADEKQISQSGDSIDFRYVYNDSIYDTYIAEYGESNTEKIFSLGLDTYEGDLPDAYLSTGGARDAYGYPIRKNFLQDMVSQDFPAVARRLVPQVHAQNSIVLQGTSYQQDPQFPGLYHCKENDQDESYFLAYFEDDGLYAAGEEPAIGFADPDLGESKKIAACDVLVEFDQLLKLNDFQRNPGVVFYRDENMMPPSVLMHGSSYFLDFSDNFSHSFLQKYITEGFDPTPGVGNFEGFVEVNHNIPWGF